MHRRTFLLLPGFWISCTTYEATCIISTCAVQLSPIRYIRFMNMFIRWGCGCFQITSGRGGEVVHHGWCEQRQSVCPEMAPEIYKSTRNKKKKKRKPTSEKWASSPGLFNVPSRTTTITINVRIQSDSILCLCSRMFFSAKVNTPFRLSVKKNPPPSNTLQFIYKHELLWKRCQYL